MRYMNDYDLDFARKRFGRGSTPNRLALVMVVDQLREWTDENSDGWAHWVKPRRAAERAMEHIDSSTNAENDVQEREDITELEMRRAAQTIRTFLARERVEAERVERIMRAVNL